MRSAFIALANKFVGAGLASAPSPVNRADVKPAPTVVYH